MSQRRKTAWVRESKALRWGWGCPFLQGHLGNSLKPFWSLHWCCPQSRLALSCVHHLWCLASPSPGTSAWGPQDPQSPLCFQFPEGRELRCLCSLSGQVNGWDMTMVTHDQARKRLTKRSEEVVRLLVTRQSLQKAVQQSMLS